MHQRNPGLEKYFSATCYFSVRKRSDVLQPTQNNLPNRWDGNIYLKMFNVGKLFIIQGHRLSDTKHSLLLIVIMN